MNKNKSESKLSRVMAGIFGAILALLVLVADLAVIGIGVNTGQIWDLIQIGIGLYLIGVPVEYWVARHWRKGVSVQEVLTLQVWPLDAIYKIREVGTHGKDDRQLFYRYSELKLPLLKDDVGGGVYGTLIAPLVPIGAFIAVKAIVHLGLLDGKWPIGLIPVALTWLTASVVYFWADALHQFGVGRASFTATILGPVTAIKAIRQATYEAPASLLFSGGGYAVDLPLAAQPWSGQSGTSAASPVTPPRVGEVVDYASVLSPRQVRLSSEPGPLDDESQVVTRPVHPTIGLGVPGSSPLDDTATAKLSPEADNDDEVGPNWMDDIGDDDEDDDSPLGEDARATEQMVPGHHAEEDQDTDERDWTRRVM